MGKPGSVFDGTVRNGNQRNPEGFLRYPGQERTFRQERAEKQQSCFVDAAALESLASSWI